MKPIRKESTTRGVGIYTLNLSETLINNYPEDQYILSSHFVKADLVHFPYFDPFFLTLNCNSSTPSVVTIHDLIPLKFPTNFPRGIRGELKWRLQRMNISKATHIITDSTSSKQDIMSILHFPSDKITVIPLAPAKRKATITILSKVKAEYKLPERFLLYIGDVNWNKNIPGLIRAFDKLADSRLHLVLVGQAFSANPPSKELKIIQKLIANSPNQSRIKVVGYVPSHHLSAFYSLATLYIQPSWYEGFGLPILEAMQIGCPTLCSDRGSLPEVGGEATVYFDPGKPNDLVSNIRRLLDNPSSRDRLVKLGKEHVKKFSWDKSAKLTHEVYEKILGINS